MINIEIYSDFVCPFCYIGETELKHAAKAAGLEDQISIRYRAFELNPQAPAEPGRTVKTEIEEKYSQDEKQTDEMIQGIVKRAESIGLEYNFDNLLSQNTLKAHRLAKYAEEAGLAEEYHNRLFEAVFKDNEFLADNATLLRLAREVGLDEEKAKKILENETAHLGMVVLDKTEAGEIGVKGVPFFVLNNKYAVQGAQPQEAFEQVLKKIAEEEGIQPKLQTFDFQTDDSGLCGPDSCSI